MAHVARMVLLGGGARSLDVSGGGHALSSCRFDSTMNIVPEGSMVVEQAMLTGMEIHHPERNEIELAGVMHALSDPHRLEIVRRLDESTEGRPCGGFGLEISKSTLTHHFRTLREAGVIRQERQGTTKMTWLRRDDLDARFPGLLDAVLSAAKVPA